MSDPDLPILITCPTCDGEGFIEHGHPNAPYADWVEECTTCDGSGEVEAEAYHMTKEDWDEVPPPQEAPAEAACAA